MKAPAIFRSFTLERTYPTSVSRVFHALSDATKKRRWFAEGEGFVVDSYTLDFQEGGFERCRFRFGHDGPPMTLDSVYLDIQENARIIFAYSMTIGGSPLSSSLGTMELTETKEGTHLRFTENLVCTDGNDQLDGRRDGSKEMLEKLAHELATHT
jgi:uncharacterized protein YndB with AHSA1/START domain